MERSIWRHNRAQPWLGTHHTQLRRSHWCRRISGFMKLSPFSRMMANWVSILLQLCNSPITMLLNHRIRLKFIMLPSIIMFLGSKSSQNSENRFRDTRTRRFINQQRRKIKWKETNWGNWPKKNRNNRWPKSRTRTWCPCLIQRQASTS